MEKLDRGVEAYLAKDNLDQTVLAIKSRRWRDGADARAQRAEAE